MLKTQDTQDEAFIKFTKILNASDYEILTPTGYKDINNVFVTVPYDMYKVSLEDGKEITVADRHRFIDENDEAQFALGLTTDHVLKTIDGKSRVKSIKKLKKQQVCYDLEVNDAIHHYYTNDIVSHNTATVAAYILHQLITREDITIAILANKEKSAKEILERIKMAYSMLPWFIKPGVMEWNKTNIVLSKGVRGNKVFAAACSTDSIRGQSASIVVIDEAAFIKHADEFFSSTFPTISSSKTSQIIMISTPKGLNHFYKFWKEAEEKKNGFKPFFSPWWENPTRDDDWAENERKTLGSDQLFAQEVLCSFIGSSSTLISGKKLQELSWEKAEHSDNNTNIYDLPEDNHRYIALVDVSEGLTQDYSVVNIIDVTEQPYKQVAVFRNNETTPSELAFIAYTMASKYNEAYLVVESNSIGKIVGDALFYDYEYENILTSVQKYGETETHDGITKRNVGVRQTAKTKQIGCSKLKNLIENDVLLIKDENTIDELMVFSKEKNTYKAEEGKTDDIVMTLVMFGWLTSTQNFKSLTGYKNAINTDKAEEKIDILTKLFTVDNGINSTNTWDIFYDEESNSSIAMIPLFNMTPSTLIGFH